MRFAKCTACFPYIPAQSKNKLYFKLRNAADVTSCEAALKKFALASLIADNCFFYANLGAHRTANFVVGSGRQSCGGQGDFPGTALHCNGMPWEVGFSSIISLDTCKKQCGIRSNPEENNLLI